MSGNIIILNGASSSGKSSLARAIQEVAADLNFYYLCMDDFNKGMNDFITDHFSILFVKMNEFMRHQEIIQEPMIDLYHAMIHLLSTLGYNVIADHIITDSKVNDGLIQALSNKEIFVVGVKCDLEELERRERQRGDRAIGLARSQYDFVHKYCSYDLELDTSNHSAKELAEIVLKMQTSQIKYNA